MIIFLSILLSILTLIVGAGVTHGYAKHRWPSQKRLYNGSDDEDRRVWATILWPFYWTFIWPFTKTNEITFSLIEKKAAAQIAKNKSRIAELQATRAALEASNAEMEAAEMEVEREVGKL
jgi:hypothetical protein